MKEKNQRILDYLDKTKQRGDLNKLFNLIFDYTLSYLKKEGSYEVSLSLIDKEEIHKLNKQYRNIDRPTDVLTFAYKEADFVIDEPIVDLGSILICPEIAKTQSKTYKHPYKRELAFLFIHGLLHIFGYEHHGSEEKAKEMFDLQNNILNTLPYDFYTNINRLKKELLIAQSHSMATYSKFKVGAVVVTKDNKYHQGFNIENSAYGVTICAERVALFSTYAQGYKKEDIVSLGCITDSKEIGSCCGSCRQVMAELMYPNCPVYIFNFDESKSLFTTVSEQLPYAFGKENLEA